MQSSRLTVSIIVPVYNGGKKFQDCLRSISTLSPLPLEVIVVADGDTDGSRIIAEAYGFTVLHRASPAGPATARNLGAQVAQGDLLWFLDADVMVFPDALSTLLLQFQETPHLSAIIGSYDDSPGEQNFLSQYKNLFHHYTHQTSDPNANTFWGACGVVRREVFWEVGGFNQCYRFPSVEDIELGYRLKAAGGSILLLKTLQIKHLKRWTVCSLLRAEFFYRALPWMDLLLTNRTFKNDLNLRWESRISILLTYLLLIFLVMAPWISFLLLPALGCFVLLFCLNRPVYRFFQRKRGALFTLQVIPWHLIYYCYCGLAVIVSIPRHRVYQILRKKAETHLPHSAS
jgi:glycosyltransferase involved in cell wall biosynthesis